MSYVKQIGDAIVTVLGTVTGMPALIVFRDTDVVRPVDVVPCAIVTAGSSDIVGATSGGGTVADMGDVRRVYEFGVSIYRDNIGTNQTGLDTNPDLVQLCQKELDGVSLTGVSSVDQVDVVRNSAWENQTFRQAVEKSVFGILVYNSETRK